MVSLDGVAARKGNRHAFVWERVYDLVARDSEHGGSSLFTKQELAKALRCSVRSVDRAILRLRREGFIESVPRYAESGAQMANAYRLVR